MDDTQPHSSDAGNQEDSIRANEETHHQYRVNRSSYFLDGPENLTPAYPMRSQNRGIYLIINNFKFENDVNPERSGAEADHDNMLSLFNQMGFIGEDHRNLRLHEMESILSGFPSTGRLLRRPDCCIVVIMSRGTCEAGRPQAITHDNRLLSLDKVKDYFSSETCERLQGIPKIFLFDNPSGEKFQGATMPRRFLHMRGPARCIVSCASATQYVRLQGDFSSPAWDNETLSMLPLPMYCDMLICWSTCLGFRTFSAADGRSWFIESICKIWSEHACVCHVEQLMKLVQEDMRLKVTECGSMQTTYFENYNFRTCFLHPGLHLQSE